MSALICVYRLFMGGFWYIKVVSIYITKSHQNFSTIITALSVFDSMLSGAMTKNEVWKGISAKHVSVLKGLVNDSLGNKDGKGEVELDPYIKNTFKAFIQSKKSIILNQRYLSDEFEVNKDFRNLIMYKLERYKEHILPTDNTNLFRSELLTLFKKVTTITLITNHFLHDKIGIISMDALLLIIKNTSLERINILSFVQKNVSDCSSWISQMWNGLSLNMINKYKECGFKIEFKERIGPGKTYHGFVINKI